MVATKTAREDTSAARPSGSTSAGADYDGDFYTWSLEQAALLRAGRLSELDLENVAEEIESLGNEQFSKLQSAYRVILMHMLKWDQQPERRTRSWAVSIATQRFDVDDVLRRNPGLKSRLQEALDGAYRRARIEAADQTDLPFKRFSVECPYSVDEVMTRAFEWPDA
ncbi:MAG TPA: DUF29 domain-containing protein [Beijerinckiaceae bacterium]